MGDVSPIPEDYPRICPYLHVAGASAAIDFYIAVFGASERMRMEQPDGKIGHAELSVGNSMIMLADEFPEMGVKGPGAYGGSPVVLSIYVEDVDATVAKATKSGAKLIRPVADQFYGDRTAQIEDPFGHVWSIQTHIEDVAAEEMERRARQAPASEAS